MGIFSVIIIFATLALIPFLLLSLTSYLKLSIVFNILRNALGLQQVPSNAVISLFSIVLSVYVMSPIIKKIEDATGEVKWEKIFAEKFDYQETKSLFILAKPIIEDFLKKNSHPEEQSFFLGLNNTSYNNFFSLIPAFITSELKESFLIGVNIFIPFLILDLLIANILASLGLFMLSPINISLPIKLLLFTAVDGWMLLSKNIVTSYVF